MFKITWTRNEKCFILNSISKEFDLYFFDVINKTLKNRKHLLIQICLDSTHIKKISAI